MKAAYKSLLFVTTFAVASFAATPQQSALSSESAEHFVRTVFHGYEKNLISLDGLEGGEHTYTSALLSAIRGRANRPLDHLLWAKICSCFYEVKGRDPTCGCPGGIRLSELSVKRTKPDAADVTGFLNLRTHRKNQLTWHLLATPKGWRINDVSAEDFPSLYKILP